MTAATELRLEGRSVWSQPLQHRAPSPRHLGGMVSDVRVSLGRKNGFFDQIAETARNAGGGQAEYLLPGTRASRPGTTRKRTDEKQRESLDSGWCHGEALFLRLTPKGWLVTTGNFNLKADIKLNERAEHKL